jgi:hypothetical protein
LKSLRSIFHFTSSSNKLNFTQFFGAEFFLLANRFSAGKKRFTAVVRNLSQMNPVHIFFPNCLRHVLLLNTILVHSLVIGMFTCIKANMAKFETKYFLKLFFTSKNICKIENAIQREFYSMVLDYFNQNDFTLLTK